jgi:hypothetical protein
LPRGEIDYCSTVSFEFEQVTPSALSRFR